MTALKAALVASIMVVGLHLAKPVFDGERPKPAELPMEEEVLEPVDARGVIEVWSVPSDLCIPCGKFADWHDKNGDNSVFRFEIHKLKSFNEAPLWVSEMGLSFPVFRFKGDKGPDDFWAWGGWYGEDDIAKRYFAHNPPALPPVQGQSEAAQANKLLGDSGTVVITPAAPVTATLDDGTVVTYTKITANYKFNNGLPAITLTEPVPQVHVKKFGVWLGAKLLGGDYAPPNVNIKTSQGKFRIKVEEAK